MVTRAEKVANGFKLNGAKMWISNAPIADIAIVWAKLEGKIRGFIVERGTKGFSTPKVEGKLVATRTWSPAANQQVEDRDRSRR